MKFRLAAVFLICILCLTCFAGCGENSGFFPSEDEPEAPSVSRVESLDVQIPINRIRTLNPAVSADEDTYHINQLIYEGLFELDEKMIPQPLLAANYEYSEDGRSLHIVLKDGVLWHDGEILTADDVKFSVDVYKKAGETGVSLFAGHVASIRSVTVESDTELTIRFAETGDTAIAKLTFPILPSHAYKNAAAVLEQGSDFIPVGTGAYKVESFDALKQLVLVGHDSYREGFAPNRLIFRVLPDKDDGAVLFDSLQLNMAFMDGVDRGILLDGMGLQMISYVTNEAEILGFNLNREPLNRRSFRQAVAAAIDKQKILDTAYYGNGVFSDTAYFPGYLGTDSQARLIAYDLKEAKRLLKESGYSDLDGDGFAEDAEGNVPKLTIIVDGDNVSRNLSAQMIQNSLAELGIPSNLEALTKEDYLARLAEGDFDIYVGGYRIDDAGDMRFLYHSAYGNPAGYGNAVLDTTLDKLMSSVDTDEKTELFLQAKDLIVEELPYYCLLYKTGGVVLAHSFIGTPDPSFNHIYQGCETWRCMYEVIEDANADVDAADLH
ncbi:MAG: ABC transporter substrate-binding protein [Firmicutes bacterium]|nr:ABC transporter substrate-binding protein [Bacillota bacterium]